MYAKLKECPHCGSAAELEDHRTVWAVKCTSTACATIMLGERAPEPDGEMGIAYWEGIKQTAIDRWNARAIAPPVAAGSVDTPELRELLSNIQNWLTGPAIKDQEFYKLILHINAWAAQHVANALREQMEMVAKCSAKDQAEFNRKWTEQKERAEKAEAELAQVKRESEHLKRQIFENGYEIQGLKYDLEEAKKPVFILPTIAPTGAFAKKK